MLHVHMAKIEIYQSDAHANLHLMLVTRSHCFLYLFSAPYFIDCISEQDLDELNIEIIRNTLYKVIIRSTLEGFPGPTNLYSK